MNGSEFSLNGRVYLIGPSGSGKTVVAQRLSEISGWTYIDTDEEIRSATGKSIKEIFYGEGEGEFRQRELGLLRDVADQMDRVVVATGGGLPMIPTAMETMRQSGATFYLHASPESAWIRISHDLEERPLLSGADGQMKLQAMMVQRHPVYGSALETVPTDGLAVQDVVQDVVERIQSRLARIVDRSHSFPELWTAWLDAQAWPTTKTW